MKSSFQILCALFVAFLVFPAAAGEITIHAASSLEAPLRDLALSYEKEKGEKIVLHIGNSDELARAIKEGAAGDLFFGAGMDAMEALVKAKVLIKGTRDVIYSSHLVIVVPQGDTVGAAPAKPIDFTGPEVKKIGLIKPESAPTGVYARAYLEKSKLWDRVQSKVVSYEDSKALLAAVDGGQVDAAILFKSEALVTNKARSVFEIEPGLGQGIVFQIALLAASRQPEQAVHLLTWLSSDEAAAVFSKYGFQPGDPR